MKNKKITTIVIIAIVALCGFLGYTFYATSTEQKEVAKKEAEQPKTSNNIITEDGKLEDRNGKKVDPTEQQKKDMERIEDVEKAQAVFMKLFTAMFNIDNKNIEQTNNLKKIVKETTCDDYAPLLIDDMIENNIKSGNKVEIQKINMKTIEQVSYDKNQLVGYSFHYDFTVLENGKEKNLENFYTDVILENGKYKIIAFNQIEK